MNGNFRGGFAPIKEGEEHDVRVEGVGEKGDGIVRIKGFVVFVPGVKEGDEVRVKIVRVLSKVGFGEVTGKAEIPRAEEKVERKPKKEEVSDEDEELLDESKDSEDFGEEETEEPEEEIAEDTKVEKKAKKKAKKK